MIIFKYNLKKYFRTLSTWILLLISFIVVVATSWVMTDTIMIQNSISNEVWKELNKQTVISVYALVSPFLIMMVALFAAFKSVQLFRDEINEGSLLLIISKPISRKNILFQKWLSLITIFVIFISPILIGQTFVLLRGIKYSGAHHFIWLGLISEFFVTIIFFCLFSSLALLVSLRLGVKSVLGLSFACTLLVIISSSMQTLTYRPQFEYISKAYYGVDTNEDVNKDFANDYNISSSWNLDNNKISDVPSFYTRINNKKPIFNKLWPFALNYQISQMTSIFWKNNSANAIQVNGYSHFMKVTSVHDVNLSQYDNSLFLDQDSINSAENVIKYFNTYNYNTDTTSESITKYLAPAMKDAETYMNNQINQYDVKINNHVLTLSWDDFDLKFPKSSIKFLNVIASEPTFKALWAINNVHNEDKSSAYWPNSFPINKHNANTIFNLLLNYQMTQTTAKLLLNKQIFNYNFKTNYNTTDGDVSDVGLYLKNSKSNASNDFNQKGLYHPWVSVYSMTNQLIKNYNQAHDIDNSSHRIKINYNDDIWKFDKLFYHVNFKNYVNPYLVSIFYFGVGIGLVPLTYWRFNRSDFS